MIIISKYLNYLNEDSFGVAPKKPVQNPQAGRATSVNRLQPKTPQAKNNPVSPQVQQQKTVPKKDMNPIQNREQEKSVNTKQYFNYMIWTSKVIKQGEIFRKNCYSQNCGQHAAGTGDRRVCKDRCDVETCKKIIQMLRASIGKCGTSKDPEKCKQRYSTLIPLYQNKLNKISKKFMTADKKKKSSEFKVG